MTIKQEIELKLSVLKGQAVWACGRAGALQWLQFGDKHVVPAWKGGTKEVGDYALHIQCAWRIRGPSGIFAGSVDRYYPPTQYTSPVEDFEWDVAGGNRCDERIDIFSNKYLPLIVTDVSADEVGGFSLKLGSDFYFEVFPDDSLGEELWRLFKPANDTPHFVFCGSSAL